MEKMKMENIPHKIIKEPAVDKVDAQGLLDAQEEIGKEIWRCIPNFKNDGRVASYFQTTLKGIRKD